MKFREFISEEVISEEVISKGSEEYVTSIKDVKNTTLYKNLKITEQEYNDIFACLVDGKINFFRKIVDQDGSFPINIVGGIVFFLRAGYSPKIILKILKTI